MKPISQPNSGEDMIDRTTSIIRTSTTIETSEPFMLSVAESLIGQNQSDVVLEKLLKIINNSPKTMKLSWWKV